MHITYLLDNNGILGIWLTLFFEYHTKYIYKPDVYISCNFINLIRSYILTPTQWVHIEKVKAGNYSKLNLASQGILADAPLLCQWFIDIWSSLDMDSFLKNFETYTLIN